MLSNTNGMRSARLGFSIAWNARALLPRRVRGQTQSLGESGRRVLEEREKVASGKNRDCRQTQGGEKRKGIGGSANRPGGGRFALPGGKKRDQTKMGRAGIGMELLVQAGRGAEDGRGDDRQGKEGGEAESA
jgi:hypothetical protein